MMPHFRTVNPSCAPVGGGAPLPLTPTEEWTQPSVSTALMQRLFLEHAGQEDPMANTLRTPAAEIFEPLAAALDAHVLFVHE